MSAPIVLALRLLMAGALYVFLGWAVWTIWQDIKLQGQIALSHKIPEIRLAVRSRKRTLVSRIFSQPEIILGRDPGCDIALDDETASARHSKISYHHGHWWVEDLQSTNGTRLNKSKLTMPVVLTSDDEIQCGRTKLIINVGGNADDSQK
jgi:pSer/pThr/pTyr-binding forkhead associated (FHA) protein